MLNSDTSIDKSEATYCADLDGLRAIAIIGVLFFHAEQIVPGGFMGVDVFFVLSGYLIFGKLLDAKIQDRLSISEFFERRFRRIFPAMWFMLAT